MAMRRKMLAAWLVGLGGVTKRMTLQAVILKPQPCGRSSRLMFRRNSQPGTLYWTSRVTRLWGGVGEGEEGQAAPYQTQDERNVPDCARKT
jgi:hypothetical protein